MKITQTESSPSDSLESKVGGTIKDLRVRNGLTIKALSEACGLSIAMISKIERGRVSASLSSLEQIALALGVPVANLFSSTTDLAEISLVKAGQGVDVRRYGETFDHRYKLVGRVHPKHMQFEPYLITLVDTVAGQPMDQHAGVEFIYILEGSMRYRCAGTVYDLSAGDCLTYEASSMHGPVELLSGEVTYLTIFSAPTS